MAGKPINDHAQEACDIYFELSAKAIASKQSSIHIQTLRDALVAAGILCINKDGTEKNDDALRLVLNRELGAFVDAGVVEKKFASRAAGLEWKRERFVSIRTPKEYEGFGETFTKWD